MKKLLSYKDFDITNEKDLKLYEQSYYQIIF